MIIPFEKYHKSAEVVLGRPVWTHEFAKPDVLVEEYLSGNQITFKEVMQKLIDMVGDSKKIMFVTVD